MIFEHHIPIEPLRRYIESFFYFEQYDSEHLIERFLPDGNVELIINLSDMPQYIYDNKTLHEIQKCDKVWASGVRTRPISIPAGQNARMFVVTFKKGMAYPFFPFPMSEIADSVVEADSIFGEEIGFLREQIGEARRSDDRFRLAEEFFRELLRVSNSYGSFTEHTVSQIISDPTGLHISELTGSLGYSKRHFIEKFKANVGLTPKAYMRILRFQKTINEIENGYCDWTDLALECGYYDQPHFINDFRVFSGFTPSEYLNKKNGNMNYVPVV